MSTKLHEAVENYELVNRINDHWRNYFADYDRANRPFKYCTRGNPTEGVEGVTASQEIVVYFHGGPRHGITTGVPVPFGKDYPDKINFIGVDPETGLRNQGVYRKFPVAGVLYVWDGWTL